MRGKYSPTVNAAYRKDQEWHRKYKNPDEPNNDPEGYDAYGYNDAGYDRAGHQEHEYYGNDNPDWDSNDDYNWAYDDALNHWGFDGVKPVPR